MILPDLPNYHAMAVLILTGLALVLFTRERIALESSSLFVLVCLVVGFQFFPFVDGESTIVPSAFFHGFGHEALVTVCALMVAGQSLVRTGALEPVARMLARFWRISPNLSLLATLLAGAILSAFMNNTPIVVLMLPMLVSMSLKNNTSTSKVLMPMGLATLVGGMSTTIGTSTNLLVVSVAADMGVEPFTMFDFVLPVVISGGLAIVYLWVLVPRMMPERTPPLADTSSRVFSAQIEISETSFAVGKTLSHVLKKVEGDLRVSRIQRAKHLYVNALPDVELKVGDMLMVSDTAVNLQDFQQSLGGVLYSGEHQVDEAHPLSAGNQQIAEVAVMAGSRLHGLRIADARLKAKYKLNLLAIHRAGEIAKVRTPGVEQRVLRASDVLLVQGRSEDIGALKRGGELLVLDGTADLPHTRKAPLALLIMALIVALAAFTIVPISISAMLGVLVLIATGCLSWRDATRALSSQVILIIVASLALGMALMKTGGADYLAQLFLAATFGLPGSLVLSALMLMMAIMTNVVSNNAAAVIGTPIAISIAQRLGLPIEPFVLAVMFGANMSYATPMGYQTNLLVMNAGGYKFSDFVRVGVPLTVLMWISLSIVLALAYRL